MENVGEKGFILDVILCWNVSSVFLRYLAKLPFIDRTRIGVFGEVRLSDCELIKPFTQMDKSVSAVWFEMLNEAFWQLRG